MIKPGRHSLAHLPIFFHAADVLALQDSRYGYKPQPDLESLGYAIREEALYIPTNATGDELASRWSFGSRRCRREGPREHALSHQWVVVLGVVVCVHRVVLAQLRDKLRRALHDSLYTCLKLYDTNRRIIFDLYGLDLQDLRPAGQAIRLVLVVEGIKDFH